MVHKPLLYQKALALRKQGKSYGEIRNILGIPKSTLSSWLKSFKLSKLAKKELEKKRQASKRRFAEFNRRRTRVIQIENQQIRRAAAERIRSLSKYKLLLIGAALYWAEGYNRQDIAKSPNISFGNSDPNMIFLFLRFIREVMKVPKEKIRPFIQVHKNVDVKSAINFWSKLCNIPPGFVCVTHQTSRASKGKRPPYLLPYGTLRLEVRGRQDFFKIKGWIDGLIKQTYN